MPIRNGCKIGNILAFWAQNVTTVSCTKDGGLGGIRFPHVNGFYCQSFKGYLSIVASGHVVYELIVEHDQPQS